MVVATDTDERFYAKIHTKLIENFFFKGKEKNKAGEVNYRTYVKYIISVRLTINDAIKKYINCDTLI